MTALRPWASYIPEVADTECAQAKNVVLNVSEMEAKVREATNDDPWCVHLPLYYTLCLIGHVQGGELDFDGRDLSRVSIPYRLF